MTSTLVWNSLEYSVLRPQQCDSLITLLSQSCLLKAHVVVYWTFYPPTCNSPCVAHIGSNTEPSRGNKQKWTTLFTIFLLSFDCSQDSIYVSSSVLTMGERQLNQASWTEALHNFLCSRLVTLKGCVNLGVLLQLEAILWVSLWCIVHHRWWAAGRQLRQCTVAHSWSWETQTVVTPIIHWQRQKWNLPFRATVCCWWRKGIWVNPVIYITYVCHCVMAAVCAPCVHKLVQPLTVCTVHVHHLQQVVGVLFVCETAFGCVMFTSSNEL